MRETANGQPQQRQRRHPRRISGLRNARKNGMTRVTVDVVFWWWWYRGTDMGIVAHTHTIFMMEISIWQKAKGGHRMTDWHEWMVPYRHDKRQQFSPLYSAFALKWSWSLRSWPLDVCSRLINPRIFRLCTIGEAPSSFTKCVYFTRSVRLTFFIRARRTTKKAATHTIVLCTLRIVSDKTSSTKYNHRELMFALSF